ncbi:MULTISPECIES: hypothetical protein, partial [Curtobacterium]|uniref:hypothetical protein n=1 Tax=Curtobacterium flaccumfaciens TaxID=2035 RepID=UPI003EE4E0D6
MASPISAASAARTVPVELTSDPTYAQGEGLTAAGTGPANTTFGWHLNGNDFGRTVTTTSNGTWNLDLTNAADVYDTFTLTLTNPHRDDVTFTFTSTAERTPVELTSDPTYAQGEGLTAAGTGPANTTFGWHLNGNDFGRTVTTTSNGTWDLDLTN